MKKCKCEVCDRVRRSIKKSMRFAKKSYRQGKPNAAAITLERVAIDLRWLAKVSDHLDTGNGTD